MSPARDHARCNKPGCRSSPAIDIVSASSCRFTLQDNLVLTQYDEAPFSRGLWRNDSAIEAWAAKAIADYDIRAPSGDVGMATLSGGNQQKTVVAREFSRDLTALVLDQPTRGLDVGSIEFIHRQVIAKRDAGAAILLVSAELDEVMELSDRVAVMYRGEIVALVDGPTAEREQIGLLMAGGRQSIPPVASAGPTDGTSTTTGTSNDTQGSAR